MVDAASAARGASMPAADGDATRGAHPHLDAASASGGMSNAPASQRTKTVSDKHPACQDAVVPPQPASNSAEGDLHRTAGRILSVDPWGVHSRRLAVSTPLLPEEPKEGHPGIPKGTQPTVQRPWRHNAPARGPHPSGRAGKGTAQDLKVGRGIGFGSQSQANKGLAALTCILMLCEMLLPPPRATQWPPNRPLLHGRKELGGALAPCHTPQYPAVPNRGPTTKGPTWLLT